MLGMGHLLCGTITSPKDSRVAIRGGTCSRHPQGEGGIQPSWRGTPSTFSQFATGVCSFLHWGQMVPSLHQHWDAQQGLSPLLGVGKQGCKQKAMESEMGGWDVIQAVSPWGCPHQRKSLSIHGLGSLVAFYDHGDPAMPPHSREASG